MSGSIRCSRCGKAVSRACVCGHTTVYIALYWQGKRYKYYRGPDNVLLDYRHAERLLTVIRAQIDAHTFNPIDMQPAETLERRFTRQIEKWLDVKRDEAERGELSKTTYDLYRGYYHQHWTPLHKYDVREIRYEQLEDLINRLPGKIKTRKNSLNGLHAFFSWLKRRGVIKDVPAWPQIKGDDSFQRTSITREEQAEILTRIPERHRAPFAFAFETGLRPGELCALKVKDIDRASLSALIQRTWSDSRLVETTKAKRKNCIPLSIKAWDIVRPLTRDKLPEAFMFINRGGQPYRPAALRRIWKKYAGSPVDFYTAGRHSFCTNLVMSGANPLDAQALMRHTDLKTTSKYYHARLDHLREVVEKSTRPAQPRNG